MPNPDADEDSDDDPEEITEFVPVPDIFHSFEFDGPFEKCTACGRSLREDGTVYLIEKAIEREEVTFEYAMCLACQVGLCQELSQGSMRVLENFFAEQVDTAQRKKRLIAEHGLDPQPWVSSCVLCQSNWDDVEWKQLVGVCDGPDLLFLDTAPMMLCGHEIERVYKLMSKKTRDRLGDFFDDVIGRPSGSLNVPIIL